MTRRHSTTTTFLSDKKVTLSSQRKLSRADDLDYTMEGPKLAE
jgi:hypothetical protein